MNTTSTRNIPNGGADVRRTAAGRAVRRLPGSGRGRLRAPALAACLASLWLAGAAVAQPRETWKGQPDYVMGLALSPDGKTLAAITYSGAVVLWDLATGKKTDTLVSDQRYGGRVAFTPDGKFLVVIGKRPYKEGEDEKGPVACSAKVWDLATQKVKTTIDMPQGTSSSGIVSHDGKSLIACGPTDLIWYDLETGKPAKPVPLDKDYQDVRVMALSADGKTLAVGTRSDGVLLWDLEKQEARAKVPGFGKAALPPGSSGVEALAFSPDGKTLAVANSLSTVELLDATNGKHIGAVSFHMRGSTFRAMAFSPDGTTLAVGGATWGVAFGDPALGGERDDFHGDFRTGGVTATVFTPDGKTLITGGFDKEKAIWFWDVPQGKAKGIKPSRLSPAEIQEISK